jgi:glycosyltransferase involved in cell wall biosynthesis
MMVSVCIPTFNSQLYIAACIDSVLAQRGVEFEIVVFDNASEDKTWDIVQSFSDPRIRSFRSDQNRGMAKNFNSALREARGEYLNLLCSDDLLEPDALRLLSAFLEDQSKVAMATCGRNLIDSNNDVLETVRWFSRSVIMDASNLRAISLVHGNVVGEPSAVLFRRRAWFAAGPFHEGLGTLIDLDMWLRLSRQGGVGYLPTPLCRIRRHEFSMTNQFRRAGTAQEADLHFTEELLHEVQAGWMVQKVSIGKVAGAYLRSAIYGFKSRSVRNPLTLLAKAFRLDPGFVGLFLYLSLFRPGLLGLKVGRGGRPTVCTASTLHMCGGNSISEPVSVLQ